MANKKSPAPAPAPAQTLAADTEPDVADMSDHRILLSDTHNELDPRVTALVIVAESFDAAVKIANEKGFDPYGKLPKGSYRCDLRLEEALPFAREGFGIRRGSWKLTEIALVHPHVSTRMDLYLRNPQQPTFAPAHLRELDKLAGPDLLSADWSVCARPPTFGNRRAQ